MKTLVLFDFDGTITSKDSLIEFIKFAVGKTQFYLGMLRIFPMLSAYKLGWIHNQHAKEKMLWHFFKDIEQEKFSTLAREYSLKYIDKIVRPKAMKKLIWHKEQGHEIVIVSASIECWLRPWCEEHYIALIGTKLSFCEKKFSGHFEGRNCYGKEKEKRVCEAYNLENYEQVYAYGDSKGDKELLALAHKRFYKPFRGD